MYKNGIIIIGLIVILIIGYGLIQLGPRKFVLSLLGVRFAIIETNPQRYFSVGFVYDEKGKCISSIISSKAIYVETRQQNLDVKIEELDGSITNYTIDSYNIKWFKINVIQMPYVSPNESGHRTAK